MSSKIVSYRRASILSGRDFGLSQTVDIVRFNLSEILYKIYSRQTNRVWGNILSSENKLFIPNLVQERGGREREGGAEGADHRPVTAQRRQRLGEPWRRSQRGSPGRSGVELEAAKVGAGTGNPLATTGSGRRRKRSMWSDVVALPVGLAQP